MIIVDTPGTNVILQRQQRLTEEFVPRADLLIFVMSADRPLTESEVQYIGCCKHYPIFYWLALCFVICINELVILNY